MIKAINKYGMISYFTEKVWNLMSENHNGFTELSDIPVTPKIPQGIIEFKAKKAEATKVEPAKEELPVVESKPLDTDASAQMEIMREFLKEKGIKIHHLTGYDKLKAIYDENRE